MYTFEINSVWFRCPEHPDEMTLEQFVDLLAVQRKPQEGDHRYSKEQLLKMISVVSGVPVELLSSLPIGVINQISELAEECILLQMPAPHVEQDISKSPIIISGTKGEKYSWQPNYFFAKLKHIRIMEDWFSSRGHNMYDRPDYLLALMLMQEGEVMDLASLSDKVKRMWTMTMKELYHPIFFFYKTRNDLLTAHASLFKDKGKKKERSTKKSFKGKVYEHWGWHHIANRLCQENRLGSTLAELDELPMHTILKQLSYMHDMAEIQRQENERLAAK